MSKQDLALNNLQWLICHKTKPNQTEHTYKMHMVLQILQPTRKKNQPSNVHGQHQAVCEK